MKKIIEKYIKRLEQLQALYEEGTPQYNSFGIAIAEADRKLVKNINYDTVLAAVTNDIEEYKLLNDLHDTPCTDIMTREQKIKYSEIYNKYQQLIDLFYGS